MTMAEEVLWLGVLALSAALLVFSAVLSLSSQLKPTPEQHLRKHIIWAHGKVAVFSPPDAATGGNIALMAADELERLRAALEEAASIAFNGVEEEGYPGSIDRRPETLRNAILKLANISGGCADDGHGSGGAW